MVIGERPRDDNRILPSRPPAHTTSFSMRAISPRTTAPSLNSCTSNCAGPSKEDIDGLEAIESLLGYYAERQPEFSFHADRASLVMRRYLKRQATAGTALSCAELHGLRCLSSICKSSSISVAKRTPR